LRQVSESVDVSDPLKTPQPKRDTRAEVAREYNIAKGKNPRSYAERPLCEAPESSHSNIDYRTDR
jgi:hypothetical protein